MHDHLSTVALSALQGGLYLCYTANYIQFETFQVLVRLAYDVHVMLVY